MHTLSPPPRNEFPVLLVDASTCILKPKSSPPSDLHPVRCEPDLPICPAPADGIGRPGNTDCLTRGEVPSPDEVREGEGRCGGACCCDPGERGGQYLRTTDSIVSAP